MSNRGRAILNYFVSCISSTNFGMQECCNGFIQIPHSTYVPDAILQYVQNYKEIGKYQRFNQIQNSVFYSKMYYKNRRC